MPTALFTGSLVVIHVIFIGRAILRPHREPASRAAWVMLMIAFPIIGVIAYVLLGGTSIGRRRSARRREVLASLPKPGLEDSGAEAIVASQVMPERYIPLFRAGHSVNGFLPVSGNQARVLPDSNAAIDAMIQDIDAAQDHVHIVFFIWLPDNNGLKMVQALKRAAARQVACRVMVDGVGSRSLVASEHWREMRAAGVRVATALSVGSLLLRPLVGRIDLRDHRKIVVIDNQITYCGSQNCADPEFRVKSKYAPWVDVVVRFDGPIARSNQFLFAVDWMAEVKEDLSGLLTQPPGDARPGFSAQAIGTGPTVRNSAMPEVFETLMYAARRELFITTPYYVPNEAMQSALCASARRGVATTVIFPARNDSWVVAAASRSYYFDLLAAGVRIFEYHGGLLHAKLLVLDGEVTLIGSANMDRRSFDLNYENNILFYDPALSAALRQRQDHYLSQSTPVTPESVAAWPLRRHLWNNAVAMLGPVL